MPEPEAPCVVDYRLEKLEFPKAVRGKFYISDGQTIDVDLDGSQADGISADLLLGNIDAVSLPGPNRTIVVAGVPDHMRKRLADDMTKTLAKALVRPGHDFQLA